jgi:enoyl-CoA hydratase/carnithine racemase
MNRPEDSQGVDASQPIDSSGVGEPEVRVVKSNGVAYLTLNRPAKRNPLSFATILELDSIFAELARDASTRVCVVSSEGPAFCAGHDLQEMIGRDKTSYLMLFETCSRMMLRIRQTPQPVIAKVQGMATAAGCQLVAACDLAVAAETARFATPGVKIGLFCSTPMVPLSRAVPMKAAMEMLLTGEPISAQRAYEIGLVNRVVPADRLNAAVAELTETVLKYGAQTIGIGKRAFYRQCELEEGDAYSETVDVMTDNAMTDDAQEGMRAFLEKRPARWSGS